MGGRPSGPRGMGPRGARPPTGEEIPTPPSPSLIEEGGGAEGVPKSRNTLGMLQGLSLPISMTIRGPQIDFCLELQILTISYKNYHFL